MRTVLSLVGLVLVAGLVGGCGGGGSSGVTPPDGGSPFVADLSSDQVVVRYDLDGDGFPDVLTLDPTTEPYSIVEALAGTADGGTVDATERLQGHAIDPVISEALAAFLARELGVAQDTDLQVVVDDRTVDVTVMD